MRLRIVAIAVVVAVLVVAGAALAFVVVDRDVTTQPNGAEPGAAVPPPPATATPPDMGPEIARVAAHLPSGSISVAALNLQTGARFTYGSTGGHTAASVFKLNILEVLMLKRQASGEPLSHADSADASVMMVTSDNDSATRLYQDVGGATGVRTANRTLGLKCTEPNAHYWGLTTTCAEDQVQLLYQLKSAASPLTKTSQEYILNLMQNVTPTQRWGVPVVADAGTIFAVKNGWLDVEEGNWVINSVGVVTYKGELLLIATLSQHNDAMSSGISLDEELAKLAAKSVTVP